MGMVLPGEPAMREWERSRGLIRKGRKCTGCGATTKQEECEYCGSVEVIEYEQTQTNP